MKYRIAIGADHRGFALKQQLLAPGSFDSLEIEWHDVGTDSSDRTDYPIYARRVVNLILHKDLELGILICGSGIGVSIVANRFPSIYAGIVWNEHVAQKAKEDDNVNILVLPADYLELEQAKASITAWLTSSFKKGRYQERLEMIDGEGRSC